MSVYEFKCDIVLKYFRILLLNDHDLTLKAILALFMRLWVYKRRHWFTKTFPQEEEGKTAHRSSHSPSSPASMKCRMRTLLTLSRTWPAYQGETSGFFLLSSKPLRMTFQIFNRMNIIDNLHDNFIRWDQRFYRCMMSLYFCTLSISMDAASIGFVIILDRRKDKWNSAIASLARIAVCTDSCLSSIDVSKWFSVKYCCCYLSSWKWLSNMDKNSVGCFFCVCQTTQTAF